MSILHLVRRSRFETQDFSLCLQTVSHQDAIVLLDDGCYNATDEKIHDTAANVYVIKSHLTARALTCPASVETITMKQLVKLTFSHASVVTWQ